MDQKIIDELNKTHISDRSFFEVLQKSESLKIADKLKIIISLQKGLFKKNEIFDLYIFLKREEIENNFPLEKWEEVQTIYKKISLKH